MKKLEKRYGYLLDNIGQILDEGRKKVYYQVNNVVVQTYWNIGRQIVEYEQKGKEKAEYGSNLLDKLSADLKFKYGKGFSRRNLLDMRRFYLYYPKRQTVSAKSKISETVSRKLQIFQTVSGKLQKSQTVSAKLSWSHYVELLKIDDDLERSFYESQCIKESWSVRQLKRQIDSALFCRLALSKNKKEVLKLAKGHEIEKSEDLIKDPYVLEFLRIPENYAYNEKELEQKIIDNLQLFLLELGRGFSFVARQYRITLGNKHYYVDLVFYNRILRCFVLIDLKINEIDHTDIGQMNMYLNYFKKEEGSDAIGLILGARKDKIKMEYALGGISNKLFVSKYKLYLPSRKELERLL